MTPSVPLLLRAILRLLALNALGALALAEMLESLALVGAVALVVASWWADEIRAVVPRFGRFWDAATIGFCIFTLLDLLFLADSLLGGVAHLLVYLLLYKLYNSHRHRDRVDIFLLTLLALLAASTGSTSFGLLPIFCGYMLLAILGLALLHLQQEADDAFPERSRELLGAPGLIPPPVLISGAGMTVLAILLTLVIFFLLPRIGRTFMPLRGPLGSQTIGFSDRVDLGMLGRLQTDPTIVMRVSFPDDPSAADRYRDLRWRGVTLERFDGRAWSVSRAGRAPAHQPRDAQFAVTPFVHGDPFLAAEVFLEPIGTPWLFGPPRLRAIHGRLPRPAVDRAGAVSLPVPPTTRIRYLAVSQPERVRPETLDRPVRPDDYSPEVRDAYLQLPLLSPRVRALGESLAAGARTPMEVIRRAEAYLEEHLGYSLDLGDDRQADPLDAFLFERKTGNCEYFAASLVVLLRVAGIPARLVNGFQRGEWNEVGQYLAVRQRDAHSWAEVYIPGMEWLTVDPSPRAAFEAAAFGPSGPLGQYFDAFRWRWNRYVVDYGIGDQAAFAMRIRQTSLKIRRNLGEVWSAWGMGAARGVRDRWRPIGSAAALAAVVAFAAVMLWRRAPGGAAGIRGLFGTNRGRTPVEFYERMLRMLTRRGMPRPAGSTAREHLAALSGQPRLAGAATELTSLYEQVRFGGHALTPAETKRVDLLLGLIETAGQ